MDTLSSSDLDSPSKTPLYVALAAVIIGLAGLGLGWLGFSKASELEAKIARLEASVEGIADLSAKLTTIERGSGQVSSNMNALSQEVNRVLKDIKADVDGAKREIRSVTIAAGENRKKLEELEKAPPAPAPVVRSSLPNGKDSGGSDPAPGPGGVYVIKGGDTLGKVAAQYKISLSTLLEANPGVEPRALRVGQEIVIPPAK